MAMFKRVNRDAPEQIFIVCRNSEGATIEEGAAVQMEPATASVDGVRVRDVDTSNEYMFVGIAAESIANGEYGKVQVYGYSDRVQVFQSGTSIATGGLLVPVAGQHYMNTVASTTASNAAVTQQPVYAVLMESITDATASSARLSKAFIRGL